MFEAPTLIDIVLFITGLLSLFITGIIKTRSKNNLINKSFLTFLLVVLVWPFSIAFFRMAVNYQTALFCDQVIYLVATIMPTTFLLFSYTITRKSPPPKLIKIISYAISLVLSVSIFIPDLFIKSINLGPQKTVTFGLAYTVWMIYYATFMTWGLILHWKSYKNSHGLIKAQSKLILIGLIFPIVGAILPNIILPYLGNYQLIFIGPITLTVMNFIITYAIIKHRFLDIRIVVARSVTYTLLIATFGTIYAGGLFLLNSLVTKQPSNTTNLLTSTGLALVIAFTFQPLLRVFEKVTNNIFYKDRYDEDELLKTLSRTVASTLTLSTLAYKILDLFVSKMNISKAYFAILSDEKLYVIESSHKDKHLELSKPEFDLLKTKNEISVFEELEEGKIKDLFREKGLSLTLPIKTKEHFIGFLILAEKSSGDIYFHNDINILEIIGPELAIALQNAQRFEEIKQFNIVLQSEVEKATEDLKEANAHLKDLDKMKDEFISVASHELRTPMTAIKGFLWLALNKHKLPKKTKETLEEAYLSTERSIALVNDMLDVSRIESGKINLNPKKADLAKLAIKVQNQLNSKITEKDLKFQIENSKPQFAIFDQDKILQVFINIVGNAIKFTPKKGTISISFKNKNGCIETSIADTGIGIKKEDFSKLFHKFGRLDSSFSSVSESPGTGLGLYITKQIIELSGGKISVTSKIKQGTTFTFTLPKTKNTKKD